MVRMVAREADRFGNGQEVVAHDDDVGGADGDIGARAELDAQVRGGQGQVRR